MTIRIMAPRRSGVFRGFDLNSYDDGLLEFSIAERPVFKDHITAQEKATILINADGKDTLPIIMRDLGYSQEDIDEVTMTTAQRTADAVRGLADAAFGQNQIDMQSEDMPALGSGDITVNPDAPRLTGGTVNA